MNDAYANGDSMSSFTKRLAAVRAKAKTKGKKIGSKLKKALMSRPNGHRGPRVVADEGDHEYR